MYRLSCWIFGSALAIVLAFPGLAPAQTAHITIQDDAQLFSEAAEKEANEKIAKIKALYKKDLFIETVSQVPLPASVDAKKDTEVNAFVSSWAKKRFASHRVDGIYVVMIKDLHKYRIEVGKATVEKGWFTTENSKELGAKLRANLKDHPDKALLVGTDYVMETLAKHSGPTVSGTAPPVTQKVPQVQRDRHKQELPPWMGYVCIGIAALAVVWVVIAIMKSMSGGGSGGAGMAGGGGGGFFPSLLGGLFGAAAGMWLYNNFMGGHNTAFGSDHASTDPSNSFDGKDGGEPYEEGGDYGGSDAGGDAGGGDWGGGDAGGDWGGGGGDWGGGGGGDW